jgi:hypothetical protein
LRAVDVFIKISPEKSEVFYRNLADAVAFNFNDKEAEEEKIKLTQ